MDSSTPSYTWSEFGAGGGETIDAYTKTETDTLLDAKADKATTLSGYGITDAYTKSEIDAIVGSAFHYKGSVSSVSELPTTDNKIGDVYNVNDTGANYAWTGTEWDKLSETVDLSGYYTKTETDTLLSQKQNTLTAGDNITISEDGTISATGGDVDLTGYLKNTATGTEGALAIGDSSTGSGRGSTAIGAGSSTTEAYSVAVGYNAKANGGLIAIGNDATASSINAMAFGFRAKATGVGSLAVGQTTASGGGAIAIGNTNKAGGSNSISIGGSISNTSGQYSLRIGYNARQVSEYDLTGNYGIGIGYNAYTTNQYGIAIGSNANVKADYGIQLGRGSNTEANTLYVGLSSSSNYKLLDADGTIPAERLVNAPGGMEILSGTDYPNPDMVGEIGQVYIKTDTEDAYMCTDVMAVEESTGTTYTYTWKEISYVTPIQPTVSVSSGELPPNEITPGKEGDIYIAILGETAPYTYVPYICTHYDLETGNHTWAKIVSNNFAPGSYVDDFVVAASGSEYTALSDGFVWATRDDSQGWVQLRNKETLLSTGSVISNYGSLFLPVSAGDKFTLEYYEGSVATLKIVYSKGE